MSMAVHSTFKEFFTPIELKAKSRGIKLSNKNIQKLKDVFTNWYLRDHGDTLSNLFWCTYVDSMMEVASGPSILLPRMGPNPFNQVVVLGPQHGIALLSKE